MGEGASPKPKGNGNMGTENPEAGEGAIRLKITSALAGIGAGGGATAGLVLTYLGNVISGYPITPGIGVYAWNMGIMAGLGAVFGPPLAWTILRRVPLWRTLTEPALAGIAGSVLAMLLAPPLFPILVPGAILGSAIRLKYAYAEPPRVGAPASLEKGPSDARSELAAGHEGRLD
jgi:MFS family permease